MVCAVLASLLLPCLSMAQSPLRAVESLSARPPLVIAHRGASGERPEHTLASYRLAIAQGADFIEPDLVATRDGVLIVRHENELSGTTDVADHAEFADRRTRKLIDGEAVSGWFSEDFTLAEIRRLRARERIPALRPGNVAFDGSEAIPTFAEVLGLLREAEAEGRRVGVYPETKHPSWFASEGRRVDGTPINVSLGERLVAELVAADFTDPGRVFIQSFELANLLDLKRRVMPAHGVDLPLILLFGELHSDGPPSAFAQPRDLRLAAERADDPELRYPGLMQALGRPLSADMGYRDLAKPAVLRWLEQQGIAGIGPWKDSLLLRRAVSPPPADPAAPRARLTGHLHPLIADARAAGLAVHPYTLRAEPVFLALRESGEVQTMAEEIGALLDAGATGFFTDHPAQGVAARDAWLARR
jgi:glycerophosphoryl diester phosphodiesterase